MKFRKVFYALIMALFAALLLNGCGNGDKHYETFSLAMNKMFGEGQWSDKGHSGGGSSLTVEGVTVNGENGESLEIARVELKKPLTKEELQSILEAKDWKDRQETVIAGGLVLKGLKGAGSSLDELNLESLSLAAAEAGAPDGAAGFLKAARVGKAAFTNFKTASAGDENTEMSLARMTAEGLAFDAEPLPGLEALDPSGRASVASSFSAKNLSVQNLAVTVARAAQADKPGNRTALSLTSLDQKDIKGLRAASSWAMTGFKLDIEEDSGDKVNFGLESLVFNDLDMTEYIEHLMPAILASVAGGEDVESAINSLQTFADLFVSPVSLKDASVKGLDFNVNGMIGLKMAECKFAGPMKAGTITPKQASSITGLEVILPESAEGLDDEALKAYQFGQDFGMSRFTVDMVSEASYDQTAGRLSNDVFKITVKDLIDINLVMSMGGLTDERLNALKEVSFNDALMALMDPEGVFGDISIENLDMTYSNLGLVERIYAYVGKTRMNGAPADQVKTMAAGAVAMGLAMQGGQYLENPGALAKSLEAFLNDPKTLKITLKPEPSLSFVSARAFEGDTNKLLNSLNLTLSANGEEGAVPLSFNIPLAPADLSQMDDEELEEYLEGE